MDERKERTCREKRKKKIRKQKELRSDLNVTSKTRKLK